MIIERLGKTGFSKLWLFQYYIQTIDYNYTKKYVGVYNTWYITKLYYKIL